MDGKGKSAQTKNTAAAFRELHERLLGGCDDVHARALLAFLRQWTPERFAALDEREALLDSNVVFRLEGGSIFLHEAPALQEIWSAARKGNEKSERSEGICLVTGKRGAIARTHPVVKGVAGAQSSGASLVSFNCPAFESYGKEQSFNAPVSTQAADRYVCALNYLLNREHRQTVRIADTSMVFWADAPVPEESGLADLFDLASPREDAQDRELVERLKRKDFRGNTLTLKIKFHDFRQITRSITQGQELTELSVILPLAKQLLREVDYEEHPIRLVGLSVSNPRDEEGGRHGVWEQLSFEFSDWK